MAHSALKVEEWPVDKPTPYAANPRQNSGAVAKVAASLKEYGFRQPIVVDEAGVIIAGHTRLLAAQSLGLPTVPVHVATGLSPAQVRAYRLADNRTAQEAEWDDGLLTEELLALQGEEYDLSLTGFDTDEVHRLLGGTISSAEADAADVPPPPTNPVTRMGDRILLGPHVLVCGDATNPDVWSALLAGERLQGVWTDPPYGVSYVGKTAKALKIENDSLDLAGLTDLLRSSLGLALVNTAPGASWWIAGPHGPPFLAFATVATELGVWRQTVVWAKDRFVLGRQDMQWQHEVLLLGVTPSDADDGDVDTVEATEHTPMLYGWAPGASHSWHGGRTVSTVWKHPRPKASREHPTMKPVALIEEALQYTTPHGAIVGDPFAGSGSTLLACEASGRVARCLELSPAYCDVIVTRWETATGKTAVRP